MKQPIPGQLLVLVTDATFSCAGLTVLIEDDTDQKLQSKLKTNASVAFGSKIFCPAQLKVNIYSKKLLAIYMAIFDFRDILWERTKAISVLTDKKSVTGFPQMKGSPPAPWNAFIHVLHFNFKIAHNAGSVNGAADFLSRLELKVTEKIRLKIRQDIQTLPLVVKTLSKVWLMKNNSFSLKQTTGTIHKNRPFNEKISLGKIQKKWWQIRNHPH